MYVYWHIHWYYHMTAELNVTIIIILLPISLLWSFKLIDVHCISHPKLLLMHIQIIPTHHYWIVNSTVLPIHMVQTFETFWVQTCYYPWKLKCLWQTFTGMTGSGCLVNMILPSKNGGTTLLTSKCTFASPSSSKSSSTSTCCTIPLVTRRFVSHFSLS